MGVDGQLQDFWRPLFPTGSVRRGDQIPQSQIFSFDPAGRAFWFLRGFHKGLDGAISFRDVSPSDPSRQARWLTGEIRPHGFRQEENRGPESPVNDRRRYLRDSRGRGGSKRRKRGQ